MELINYEAGTFDIAVVGAGHAGCEAALASARMGMNTLIVTMNLDSIAAMSCNPNIGGTGKGHLVREIDALGGEMALNIDKTFIQSRMLNTSKGSAVHSLRVQADKRKYHTEMKKVLEDEPRLTLRQSEIVDLLTEDGKIKGIVARSGAIYRANAVIIAGGTYLKGKVFFGEGMVESGPDGMFPSNYLSAALERLGFRLRRLKTGTPARVHRDTIDFSVMEVQPGDAEVVPFSFLNAGKTLDRPQVDCYLTYTTPEMHDIIRAGLYRSPMYQGEIDGIGPRYCPSIEDKVVRFSDKEQHQVFIEPEGEDTKEIYVQGVSSTLPEEVQLAMYRKIIGLEKVELMRSAYAIEYDAIDATKLKSTLESRTIENLFFAGQVCGSSGYEEAAAQGIMAGINAVLKLRGEDPLILDRSEGYIGVLIDDLVTKGSDEPYRMMTSRAEYRLTLRQDNADLRLTAKSHAIGLADRERFRITEEKRFLLFSELDRLAKLQINPTEEHNHLLKELGSTPIQTPYSVYELIRRPELSYEMLKIFDPKRPRLRRELEMQIETHIKYEGYIQKQQEQIDRFKKLEHRKLEEGLNYWDITGLSTEAKQKLDAIRPDSVGQASRISGVSPSDINVLLIWLEQRRRERMEND